MIKINVTCFMLRWWLVRKWKALVWCALYFYGTVHARRF